MKVRIAVQAFAALVLLLTGGSTPVHAGMWSSPAGVAQDFTYSSGQDEHGFFGDPIILGNKLIFTPSPFVAHAASQGTSLRHDTVSFEIAVNQDVRLDSIGSISMSGYYSAEGSNSLVDAWSEYYLHEQGGSGRHFEAEMDTGPVNFPVMADTAAVSGTWAGEINVQVPGPANPLHRFLLIEFSTTVMASAAAGGSATVSEVLPQIEFEFEFVPIPEPGSIALMALGCVFLFRRTYNRRVIESDADRPEGQ